MSVGVCMFDEASLRSATVRLVLLHDSEGKALVILPANHLLNLVALWRDSARHLQPVKSEDVGRFFRQQGLQGAEGQRKLFSLPVFIDPACAHMEKVEVVEPHSGLQFTGQKEWYAANARVLPVGLSPEQIAENQPSGNDEQVITKAVERFTALRIKQRLEDTLGLPSLPPTAQKIIDLRADPGAGVDGLVPIVKVDPSLSAQVMSWAVSPYYAAPGDVQSIEDAVIRVLGFDLVVNLALGIAMGKTLSLPDDVPRGQTPYWRQAVYTATLAERLAKVVALENRPKPGLVYLTGLVHNFGYAVLAHLFPPHFSLLSRYIEANPHMSLEQTERQVLNVTREQIAAWLFETWSLPESVCQAVRHINNPSSEQANPYSKVVYLASRALRQAGLADGPIEPLSSEVLEELGITEGQINSELKKLLEKSDELIELVEMVESQQRRQQS